MKSLVLIIFIFSISNLRSYAGGEAVVGVGVSNIDFTTNFGTSYDYTSTNLYFVVGGRAYFELDKVLVGAVANQSYNDMNLDRNVSDGSDNSFKNLHYGGYLGVKLGDGWRLDLEYYLASEVEILYSQGRSSNAFSKGDKLKGTGFGIGITKTADKLLGQLVAKMFTINEARFDGTSYDANSTEFKSVSYPSVSLNVGYIF